MNPTGHPDVKRLPMEGGIVLRVLAAAFFLLPPLELWGQAVEFAFKERSEGSERIESEKLTMAMDLTVKRDGEVIQSARQAFSKETLIVSTVLESRGGKPTKYKVHYKVARETEMGLPQTTSVHEKSYMVSPGEPKPEITYTSGKTPQDTEKDVVARDFRQIGKGNVLQGLLNGKTMKSGDTIDAPLDVAKRILGGDVGTSGDFEAETITFTMTGTREVNGSPCAAFLARVVATRTSPAAAKMKLHLTGELLVSSNCDPLLLDLKGTATIDSGQKAKPGQVEIKGKGPVTFKRVITFK